MQVGETLSVNTSGISDHNGIDRSALTYQWIANDGTEDTDIQDATGSTYILAAADEGKTIKVRVSFTDDGGNQETRTSAVTVAVAAIPNSVATGAPAISGTVQVGQTLTASTSGISDSDGLTNPIFTYQWLSSDGANDSAISGANSSTYTPVELDEGKIIQVRVSFTDDRGHQETRTSTATVAVAAAPSPLTAATHDAPGSHNGQAAFKFELRFSEDPTGDFSYKTLRDHAFTVTGGDVAGARRLDRDSDTPNIRWEISVSPDFQSGRHRRAARHHGLRRARGHLHRGRQDAGSGLARDPRSELHRPRLADPPGAAVKPGGMRGLASERTYRIRVAVRYVMAGNRRPARAGLRTFERAAPS